MSVIIVVISDLFNIFSVCLVVCCGFVLVSFGLNWFGFLIIVFDFVGFVEFVVVIGWTVVPFIFVLVVFCCVVVVAVSVVVALVGVFFVFVFKLIVFFVFVDCTILVLFGIVVGFCGFDFVVGLGFEGFEVKFEGFFGFGLGFVIVLVGLSLLLELNCLKLFILVCFVMIVNVLIYFR